MRKTFLSFFIFIATLSPAQDSLPDFSVVNKGNNRIVISWNNKFKLTRQISVQRSPDSLNNFKSIVTVPDPMNRQNGYLDTRAPHDQMFYRLYILVDGSNFIFTKSKKPLTDSQQVKAINEKVIQEAKLDSVVLKLLEKIEHPKASDPALTEEEILILKNYRNSRMDRLPDSISRKIDRVIKLNSKPEFNIPVYRIVTTREGLVQISLNDFKDKKYSIKFFEDDDSFLFELKTISESLLILDKSNFYHSGWFKSELYENGKMVEKNRFFIPKDF
ncbi:MAG TPA: hypothetical protein VI548_05135 [Chitinophagaceae bacterium]|nr:hypothetical protein [Chitinophagaceae bacterium]